MTATFPPAASPSQQPPGLEEDEADLDEYDLYGLSHVHLGGGGRKGRTKREAAANTNRPSPGGHERKLVTKLQNAERKSEGPDPEVKMEVQPKHGPHNPSNGDRTADWTTEELGPGGTTQAGLSPLPTPRTHPLDQSSQGHLGGTEAPQRVA